MSRSQAQNDFYNTKAWRKIRVYILEKNNFMCQKCRQPAKIVHHIEWITEGNLNDPEVTLNEDNLMAVCHECHNSIHYSNGIVAEGLRFNDKGEVVPI